MKVSKVANYEVRLGDVFRTVADVLRRRKLVLGLVTLVVTVLGVTATMMMTKYYQGVTLIQIDPSRNPLTHSNTEAQAQLASEGIETEVQVLTSRELVRTVVKRLNMVSDPEFNVGLAAVGNSMSQDAKEDFVATAVGRNLDVSRQKLTYVIAVKFASRYPEKAAQVANAFAAAYLNTKVGSRIGTAEKQAEFYNSQLNQLAADARAADANVAQFQSKSGLIGSKNGQTFTLGTITDQQIGPLSLQIASAESIAAETRSKELSARQMVARGQLDLVSQVRTDFTIQQLRSQRAVLVENQSDMENRYGEMHPDLIKVRKQIEAIDKQIRLQADRVIAGMKSDADAAEAQAGSLRHAMQALEEKRSNEARASVEAASLQRDADSKHQAYDRMAQAALETRQAVQNSIAQAQIIDSAQTPQFPYWPNRPLMFALSLFIGFGLGLATIATQEVMVSGLSSVSDVEDELGIPLLAAVPNVTNIDRPADLLIERPTSQFAESLRNARASILGVRAEDPPKIIAMTSALPSEGKTTTALGLARTMAISGSKTIIVDADARRAQLKQIIDASPDGEGTVGVLHGKITVDQAIRKTQLENLDAILVTKAYFSSEDLFGGDTMQRLLDELSKRYDCIILDLPPLIGLADGRFLSALADAVVLAVKWNATPSQAVGSAVSWLKSDGANLIGAMFTMVDTSSHVVGAYYYYYGNKYSSYYQDDKK